MGDYADFSIQIGPLDNDALRVRAQFGKRVATEHVPLTALPALVRDPLQGLASPGDLTARDFGDTDANSSEAGDTDATALGDTLYEILFAGEIGTLYGDVVKPGEEGSAVRIRLYFNFEESALLARLPWELMRRHRNPLVLSEEVTIVRSIEDPEPVMARAYSPPLRILLIASNPNGDLKLDTELHGIRSRLTEMQQVMIDVLEDPSERDLNQHLIDNDYEIVHFMGHGAFHEGVGSLVLAGGNKVTGDRLRLMMLGERRSVRLVVLNACRTGEVGPTAAEDAFAGVAAALVKAGPPAVVAMQFPVSDDGAVDFAERFYSSIVSGLPVEQAVDNGRRALITGSEWATPVLYLRDTGNLFVAPATPDRVASAPGGAAVDRTRRPLLPHMVDRRDVVNGLRKSIAKQRASSPSPPVVAVIHGDEQQQQTKLSERLQIEELPDLLDLDRKTEKAERIGFGWPSDLSSRAAFQEEMIASLASKTRQRQSRDDILDYLVSLPAPVMLVTHVECGKLGGRDGLGHYLDFWQNLPRRPGVERIFAFLFVHYRRPEDLEGLGIFQRLQASRRNREVEDQNKGIRTILKEFEDSSEAVGGIILTVPKELGPVTAQDLMTWADDQDQHDLLDELIARFRSRQVDEQPISAVVSDIEDLIKSHQATGEAL